MGSDIYMYLEKKNNKGVWKSLDYYKKSDYYECGFEVVPIYDGRNYSLFSILANVRNYGNNEPICEPKGIPNDCCEDIMKEYEKWGCDAYSASYFTLKELKEYKSTRKFTKFRGMISQEQIKQLENGIKPNSWCQGTNMEGYEFREWTEEYCELDPIIESMEKRICDECWIWYETEEEKQEKLKKYEDDVRIVFWFDN